MTWQALTSYDAATGIISHLALAGGSGSNGNGGPER